MLRAQGDAEAQRTLAQREAIARRAAEAQVAALQVKEEDARVEQGPPMFSAHFEEGR